MNPMERRMKNLLDKVRGFSVCATKAGIKASGKLDLGLIYTAEPVAAAGVFTQSKVVAAPVTYSRKNLKSTKGMMRAIIVNAGNANACTGKTGMDNAAETARLVAQGIGCKPSEVLICSTGIIGVQLPMEKVRAGVPVVTAQKGGNGAEFTQAILTTDLVKKTASATACGGSIAGVCKGSGMIAPNMATMLGYILTDIAITPAVLQIALRAACDMSFNCLTVDGDTSTNDTVLCLASGKAGNKKITAASGKDYEEFLAALKKVCYSLAKQVAQDGEGATKLVVVNVEGAKSAKDAKLAGKTISESPLVKTAMFGNDPNWGRIVAALGRSGCAMVPEKTSIRLCGKEIFAAGTPKPFNADALSKAMKKKEVVINVQLGLGKGSATLLTCDFSYDYVKINADYHT